MNYKNFADKYIDKVKELWHKGKIQKSFRITYDVVWNVVLFFLIVGCIGLFFAGGTGAGYFASLVKDEPVRSSADMREEIYNYEETSELYFADNKYLGNIRSDLYREETTLEKVSDHVENAIIATEDSYFETHNGVVPKAILRAIFQEATNSSVKTGGSTLTQQLIKNQILTNEVSFERKAKEILLAMRLEKSLTKDEILEAYLNIVPFGRDASGNNIAGIETAAQGIFGIDASEVNLPQAAYLAGLPQSPSYYTPFTNGGEQKSEEAIQPGLNRMQSVLSRMLEAGYITEEEYKKASAYDITADFTEPTKTPLDQYPYLTNEVEERAKEIITLQLAEQDGYTEEDIKNNESLREEYRILADRNLRRSGYKIHTTINKEIYDEFQRIGKEYDNYGPDKPETIIDPKTGEETTIMEPVQAAGMLIENKTGKIISFLGGRGYDTSEVNHATDTVRNNGSTMKPLLVYGPAMEAGAIQPGSVVLDVHLNQKYPQLPRNWPKNYSGNYHGLVTAREALKKSYNIPAVTTYTEIIDSDPAANYLEKMGFTSLTAEDHTNASLAIGSMGKGVTVEENTNAFSTFGNNGKFVDAYMIEKIETNEGEVLFEHETKEVEVFSPQTNYLTVDMMRDVLNSGTATYTQSRLTNKGVDWAGKTGTSVDWWDAWFVATNPNVTMGSWIGYDTPKELTCNSQYPCSTGYSNRNIGLWSELVNAATKIDPELMAPENNFSRPDGIQERSFCRTSGMKPSDLCQDIGLVSSDIFNAKYTPAKEDNSLVSGNFVKIDGKTVAAGKNTPSEFTSGDGVSFNADWLKETMYNTLSDLSLLRPRGASGGWDDIAFTSGDKRSSDIKDDGKAPSAPGSLSNSGKNLKWKKSSSNDVVGYRIFRADRSGGSFSLIGNTTDTSFKVPSNGAVYHVKAVDYFGRESSASKTIQIGDIKEDDDSKKNKERKDEKNQEDEEEEEQEQEEDDSSNSDEEEQTDEGSGSSDEETPNDDEANEEESGQQGDQE
ncbi:transglycosylase domain-containing protein [Sediminibacillus albus]|uniref:Penicillin-binding protein n=1 Tax=Sediminibacillus albus TaxID=407036 RepID=A0A1G9BWL2_9BACI|nr:transglycosylase domain-containing protein [Sediminibacillus albus]SDK43829.1 penicillin-binding protein [Sediminibacillus albus]